MAACLPEFIARFNDQEQCDPLALQQLQRNMPHTLHGSMYVQLLCEGVDELDGLSDSRQGGRVHIGVRNVPGKVGRLPVACGMVSMPAPGPRRLQSQGGLQKHHTGNSMLCINATEPAYWVFGLGVALTAATTACAYILQYPMNCCPIL